MLKGKQAVRAQPHTNTQCAKDAVWGKEGLMPTINKTNVDYKSSKQTTTSDKNE